MEIRLLDLYRQKLKVVKVKEINCRDSDVTNYLLEIKYESETKDFCIFSFINKYDRDYVFNRLVEDKVSYIKVFSQNAKKEDFILKENI